MAVEQGNVTRVRQLLREAAQTGFKPAENGFASHVEGIRGPLRRRAMVKRVRLAAAYYGLDAEIDAFLAEAGCASLSGLDDVRLRALSGWLGAAMDRLQVVADHPDAPAAR
jgi:hypothetical protein